MFEELLQKSGSLWAAWRCRSRTTNFSRWQGTFNGIRAVVIQLVVFFRGAMPITNVRFIPNLPLPAFHLGFAIFINRVFHPLVDEFAPFRVVFRWLRPSNAVLIVLCARNPSWLVGVRSRRECLGHKPDLDEGLGACIQVGAKYAIDDCPVIYDSSGFVFRVGVSRAPLQPRLAIARCKQKMRTNVRWRLAKIRQFVDQLAAIIRVCVVWFVIPEVIPYGLE